MQIQCSSTGRFGSLLLLLFATCAAGCEDEQPVTKPAPTPVANSVQKPAPTAAVEAQLTASESNDKNCTADPAWVNDPSEPDATKFSANSNCSFHQWAYQMFLWLTSPGPDGALVFESFGNPTDLFVPSGPPPYPGRTTADAQRVRLLARVGKSQTTADVEDIFQAGPGNKVLVDQSGEVVYYSNHINQAYWDFIKNNQYYELAKLQAVDPGVDFPEGALELKASWRVVEKAGKVLVPDAAQRYHVIKTEVPTVTVDKTGKVVEDKSKLIPVSVALTGMHVTGVVKGHPEFIWATFEHVDNAPDCAKDPSQPAAKGDGPTGPWALYKPGTPTKLCNQFNVSNPLAVVNVCLVHPNGGGSADNQNAITTLNKNVAGIPPKTPWTNYHLIGGVWTNGDVPLNNGAFAPDKQDATQLGSLDLANTTMETFTQNDNCFACHNGGGHEVVVGKKATEVGPKNLNLSHFVVNYQAVQQATPGK